MLKIIHHWWLPVISAACWWGMLIALLVCWAAQGHPIYPFVRNRDIKHILYISDISATNLQGIFIAGAASQGLFFVLGLASERLLRHNGRLRPNMRRREKYSSYLALALAIIGELGILFVSIFNTHVFPDPHTAMLVVFIVFVGASSLASIYEYFYLDQNYPDYKRIAFSVRFKAVWFIVELALAIGFGVCGRHNRNINAAAVLEWCISFIYPFYTLNIAYDLWPARNTLKGHHNNRYPNPFQKVDPEQQPQQQQFPQEPYQQYQEYPQQPNQQYAQPNQGPPTYPQQGYIPDANHSNYPAPTYQPSQGASGYYPGH